MNVVGDGKVNWYCCPESWVTDIKLNNDYAAILCHWLSVKWQFYQGLDATGNVSVLMKGFILETDDSMEVWGAGAVVGWCLLLLSLMLYDCLQSIHCCFMFFCQWLPWRCRTDSGIAICSRMSHVVAWIQIGALENCPWVSVSQCQSVSVRIALVCQCQSVCTRSYVNQHCIETDSYTDFGPAPAAPPLRSLFYHVRLAQRWHVAIEAWQDGGSASPF
jgi:hypothetical protein